MKIVIGLDDFSLDNNKLDLLSLIKKEIVNFKCTLFTIPKLTPLSLQKEAVDTGFVELAMHGSEHSIYEFAHIKHLHAKKIILKNESPYMVKGFKAPNWSISEDTLYVLKELGYWVALHKPENNTINFNKVFYYNSLISSKFNYNNDLLLQGHLNNYDGCPDYIDKYYDKLIKELPKDAEYQYISEYLN